MNIQIKETDEGMKTASIIFNAIAAVLLYGVIRVAHNWETLKYDNSEASMIVFFFGLICYGISVMFYYEIGCSVGKGQSINIWAASLLVIPGSIAIASSITGYWEFNNMVFLYQLLLFLMIVPTCFYIGKMTTKIQLAIQ